MNITFTFEPSPVIQEQLIKQFPSHNFIFKKGELPSSETEIWVTYGEDVTANSLRELPSLKWMSVASAGIEKMPLDDMASKGIKVTNARGIHKTPMSESILGHILSLYRNLPAIYELKSLKKWDKPRGARELRGSTAVILGPGAIGAEVARLLKAFGVHVIACNRSGHDVQEADETITFSELKQVLPDADILLSLVPSTNETRNMLTEAEFNVIKPGALFMNFGRGDVVDEQVLIDALKSDHLSYAVLDVFAVEPLPSSSELWELDQVVISPHISSHSSFYVERAMEIFSRNLTKWESGETDLENEVDLNAGY